MEFELRAIDVLKQVQEVHKTPTIIPHPSLQYIEAYLFQTYLYLKEPLYNRANVIDKLFDNLCCAILHATAIAVDCGFDYTHLDLEPSIVTHVPKDLIEKPLNETGMLILDCLAQLHHSIIYGDIPAFKEGYQLLWVILYKTNAPLDHIFTEVFPRNLKAISGNI